MRRNVQAAVATLATMARSMRVPITHFPIVDPADLGRRVSIQARIHTIAPLVQDSVIVRYAVDGGAFVSSPTTRSEAIGRSGPRRSRASPREVGSSTDHARDMEGRSGRIPPAPPRNSISSRWAMRPLLGSLRTGLRVDRRRPGGFRDDGIWARGRPIGTGAQPGADAAGRRLAFASSPGTVTPGGDIGEEDVDNGRTTLTSPRDLTRDGGRSESSMRAGSWMRPAPTTPSASSSRTMTDHPGGSSRRSGERSGRGSGRHRWDRSTPSS